MVNGALNYNGERAYAKWTFVVTEGLDFFKLGDYSIRQFVLREKDFGWMALWELNPEVLGSVWLMASATWREWEGNHFG
jgi:hypothetical protein